MSIIDDPAPSGLTSLDRIVPIPDPSRDARLAPRARQISISAPRGDPQQRLADYLERTLNNLLALPAGWDGSRAKPLARDAVTGLIDALNRILQVNSALPQLFPLSDGGIQAEWLVGGNSIEIEITPHGEAFALATTAEGHSVAEGPLDGSHADTADQVREFLAELSARLTTVR